MRLIRAVLTDPSHRLPMADRGGRLFAPEGETIDADAPLWIGLLADGSVREAPEPPPAEAEVASDKPASRRA